ncbi:MAG: potassium channel family protein [Shimia thalassica]|uniref:potassium channel family protein n=1 Tax=Shimia thalassica TaxID=1715693 RepID=UPI0032983C4E
MSELKTKVNALYTGQSRLAVLFRYGLILFDLMSISYFILVTPLPHTSTIDVVNLLIGVVILVDFLARFWISQDRLQHASRIYVIADVLVLLSLALNRFSPFDLAFLRILRGLRLGHSQFLLQDLRRASRFFRRREDAIVAAVNMFVFVFTTASMIYTFFGKVGTGYSGYVDAVYFTISTLTTTGYGDITPVSVMGKIVSMGIMVVGVSLFLNLARSIVMPPKVRHTCSSCGLKRHDEDAVHCKHCGEIIHIETMGAS